MIYRKRPALNEFMIGQSRTKYLQDAEKMCVTKTIQHYKILVNADSALTKIQYLLL